MGIIRDLIGGAVQQGMAPRNSNSGTDDYQTFQPDYNQRKTRPVCRRLTNRGREFGHSPHRSLGQGCSGEQQQASQPSAFAPRLPPRPSVWPSASPRVYHSVTPSDALAIYNKGNPTMDSYSPHQPNSFRHASLSYPVDEPTLPEYDEDDTRQDDQDEWYGLSVPVALPQTGFGQGVPFMRAYSDQLEDAGIPRRIFVEFLDTLNATVVPNPETQIANKAAGLAGWFVYDLGSCYADDRPGAGGIALGLVQVGAQVGGAIQLKRATATCLQQANQTIFRPVGLQALICKSQDIDDTIGLPSSFATNSPPGAGYVEKLMSYGSLVAPLTSLPALNVGRTDMTAQLAASLSSRSRQKTQEKAARDMASGKMKRTTAMDQNFNWLLVRNIMA